MTLAGQRIAVAGMGRSGLAIAAAAVKRGATTTVYDEHAADSDERMLAVEKLQGLGVDIVTGWHGRLADESFDMLVASPGFKREHPAIRDAQALGKEVVSEVEFAYRIAKSPILAITGTNGKSTTTVLTWLLLKGAGVDAVLCGNVSGSGYPELTLTEAADLENTGEDSVLVAEVSSYQLEWVDQFRPRVASITNITPDHLDRHPSFEDYRGTKLRLFSNMGDGDCVVLNFDEPSLPIEEIGPFFPQQTALRLFSSSLESPDADVKSQPTHTSTRREEDAVVLGLHRVALSDLPLVGEHNVVNAMQAWEIASAYLGAKASSHFDGMLSALLTFKGLHHRMERLGERGGVLVVNNSMCTNPAAVIVSSSSLPMRQHILMGGLTKNLEFSPVKAYLNSSGHRAYLYGSESTLGEGGSLGAQLGGEWPAFSTLDQAFRAAADAATSGEAILLAPGCLSAYPYDNFRERGDAFRGMVEEWLRS